MIHMQSEDAVGAAALRSRETAALTSGGFTREKSAEFVGV